MKRLYRQSIKKLEMKAKIRKKVTNEKNPNITDECEWHTDNCYYCKDTNGKWIQVDCLENN